MMIEPDRLQFSAIRVLIDNLPSYMPLLRKRKAYLGAGANDTLRVVGEGKKRIDHNHADFIMDLFTFMFNDHTTGLIFPASRYIPTSEHLKTHLLHHGHRITELSLASCTCYGEEEEEEAAAANARKRDLWLETRSKSRKRVLGLSMAASNITKLLEIICSSAKVLKSLTLPKCKNCVISKRDADIFINSHLVNTLQELTLLSIVFMSEEVIQEILSSLINLKVLNLSHVSTIGCRARECFLIPLNWFSSYPALTQLEHLRIYDNVDCPCEEGCVPYITEREWEELGEQYTNLKTLQISCHMPEGENALGEYCLWLHHLKNGLRTRKEPLEYLSVMVYEEESIRIIRQMNANKITVGETLEEILYEMLRGDRDDLTIRYLIFDVMDVWRKTDKKTHKLCGDMLAIINILIPNYRHIYNVFETCGRILVYMVEDLALRQALKLTPSFIETFITRIMGPENEKFPLYHIFRILRAYDDVISVDVFETVFRRFSSIHNPSQYSCLLLGQIYKYIANLGEEYMAAMKRIWGPKWRRNIIYWFSECSELVYGKRSLLDDDDDDDYYQKPPKSQKI